LGWVERRAKPRIVRPLPVALIALFQFAKGVFFLLVAALLLLNPTVIRNATFNLSPFTSFFSADGSAMAPIAIDLMYGHNPGGLSASVVAVILILFGLWLSYLAIALWRMEWWARGTRIGVSVLQILVGLLVLRVYVPGLAHEDDSTGLIATQWTDLAVLLLINGVIMFYLVADVDVRYAFGVKDSR
jgi:hypothetical protein